MVPLKSYALIMEYHLFRERVPAPKDEAGQNNDFERRTTEAVATTLHSPDETEAAQNGPNQVGSRSLLKSASISASKCVGDIQSRDPEVMSSLSTFIALVNHIICPSCCS